MLLSYTTLFYSEVKQNEERTLYFQLNLAIVLELKITLTEGGNTMKVIKVAKIAREPNSGKLFTGIVTVQPVIGKELSKNLVMAKVNFGPGVRNKFHSHSSEQILIVTKGKGIVATEKEQKLSSWGILFLSHRVRNTGMVQQMVLSSRTFTSCPLRARRRNWKTR